MNTTFIQGWHLHSFARECRVVEDDYKMLVNMNSNNVYSACKYEQQQRRVPSAWNQEQHATMNTYNRTLVFATLLVKSTGEGSNPINRWRKRNEKQLYLSETLVPVARIFSRVFLRQTGLIMHAPCCFAATNAASLKCKWPSNQSHCHIESFFAFQPLFFEDLMLKFAKDNCFTPVASPAGTDDPWSVVGFIRKAAQPLYRRQSLCWLFNLPCNYAWDCCDTCWCCCAQTTHDPNLSKREGKPTGLGAQPQYRLFTLLRAAPHTRPTSAKPNRGGGRCGDSEGWICLLRRIVTLWSNRRLDISRPKQVVRPDLEGSVGMVEGVLRMRSDFE